ncbi:MAG: ATP-binding protein [Methanoregula sp.]|nr:ATP-binding protein [Methanoregula sp.]
MTDAQEAFGDPGGNPPLFRIVGDSVLHYCFFVPHDERIFVGDIVTVNDREKGYLFFAKVSNLYHGKKEGWVFKNENSEIREKSPERLNPVVFVEAIPLGVAGSDGTLRQPGTLPTFGSAIQRLDKKSIALLKGMMGSLEVGEMRSGPSTIEGLRVGIHGEKLNQHMGVFATTGMGKSNFMKVFCASCMKKREFGVLIVDPHGEYVGTLTETSGRKILGLTDFTAQEEGLEVFSIRSQSLAKNRKKEDLNVCKDKNSSDSDPDHVHALYIEYDDFRMSDLALIYDMSGSTKEIVESLDPFPGSTVIDFFLHEGVDSLPSENKTTSYISYYPKIAAIIRGSPVGAIRVIEERLKNLVFGSQKFFRESGSSIPDIMERLYEKKVVIIDIPDMSEKSELFLLSAITRAILKYHQDYANALIDIKGRSKPQQVLICIEEAQRVLTEKADSTSIFRQCMMEGRKFGIGLCVITQQPKNIDNRILAQINTLVIMGLADQKDRQTLTSSAKQDLSHMDTEIQVLGRGDAIISSIGIPLPVSTKIHLFDDYIRT